jgi:putative ABC transport system substrate-binding protein
MAAELVALSPDVILASGVTSLMALRANRDIPQVFAVVPDPVGAGFVESLARPGGNVTGFMQFEYNLSGKWLELLKEIAPGITRAAVLRDADISAGIGQFAVIQAVAPSVGVDVQPIDMRDAVEIERAIATFARVPNGGLIVTASPWGLVHRELVAGLAIRQQVAVSQFNTAVGDQWRPCLLWGELCGVVSGRGRLRRPYPQGRETSRPSGAGAYQVRVGN